ncbi:MAG: homoserine dehydrogenase [Oscillospiraceae bacterium]|nr:homoserine dehydrogenase [Oscillospiraceae bacterium]
MVEIAVMGYGVVGTGVVQVLTQHAKGLTMHAHEQIHVKYILVRHDYPEPPMMGTFTQSFDQILNDPEIRIVVEVMGGLDPAYSYVRRCLQAGKSVVTSNKELVAAKGADLLQVAKDHNVNFLFEASVGGGIPIIRPMSQCLAANVVVGIAGILNGTTNYILTKMFQEGVSFKDALADAQRLGYAERDPTADIEGDDACRKICILASLAYGKHVYPQQVHTEGITHITLADVKYAQNWGGVVKLIGEARHTDNGKVDLIVCPMFIQHDSQLANVDDVFNGIMVRGDITGDIVFYGKGAGKMPTASAVVADVIDCVKHLKARKYLYWSDGSPDYVVDYREASRKFYIRARAKDPDAAFEEVEALFPGAARLYRTDAPEDEFAFVTEQLQEKKCDECLLQMKEKGISVDSRIRIGDM